MIHESIMNNEQTIALKENKWMNTTKGKQKNLPIRRLCRRFRVVKSRNFSKRKQKNQIREKR